MALNIQTFIKRTITAVVFVAILLFGICYNYISFVSLFFVLSIWGLHEFYLLAEKLNAKPYKNIGYLAGIGLFLFSCLSQIASFQSVNVVKYILPSSFLIIFMIFVKALFDKNTNPILNIAYTIMGIIYVVLPFSLLVNISCIDAMFGRSIDHLARQGFTSYNYHYVLGIIMLIWISDVSAYLVGSFLGKHKLYERISPGKTWEGSIGAAFLTIAGALVIASFFAELELKHWVVISLLVSVFGTIGDLVESMMKRQAGVKDSGKIMPGHGGILDRFDSLLFVSPFIYAYLTYIK
jgi:phosphatidate cytidylyltransferase